MKKIFAALFVLGFMSARAGFVNQLVFIGYETTHQVDSILQRQGIPSGVFVPQHDVKLYKVIYNTVDWDSNSTSASGLLCVPVNNKCEVSMLSYQHGTTIKKHDVPSRLQTEWFVGLAAASLGYVTVLPDYLGLGDSPGLHPYQHAHTEATAVIDMIRAAKEVVDTMGAPVNDQLFLFGYSQGGHATMAAHELIQETLDSVMHVTASAPMSGAYDMSGVMGDLMASDSVYPEPYYLPYLIFGYNEVYHLFANDSDVLIHPYDTTLPPLFDGTHDGGAINAAMPNVPKLIMQPTQIDSFVNDSATNYFRVVLSQNNTFNWLPTSPIRMYYCQGDKSVPYQNAMVAYHHFIQNGATNVDTVDVNPTLDHYPCAQFAILAATYWFDSLVYKPLVSGGVTAVNSTSAASPNGTATALPTGGHAPYSFSWSTGDTTESVGNLAAGTYYVTVTDKNLCSYTDSTVISLVSGIQNAVLSNFRIYPNPAKQMVNIMNTDPSDAIKETTVYDMSGRVIKTYAIRQDNNIQLYFDGAADGIYFIRLRSETGKEAISKITILNQQ
ncbi:MAG TPA: alpha/beta fold hydrolase [Chitinophagales bacterium]|nr:alpha/beta fold hydrolase [Chitinophagales bacterium]